MLPSTYRGHSSSITGDVSKRVYGGDSLLPAKRVKQEAADENQNMNVDDDEDDLVYGDETNYDDYAPPEIGSDITLENGYPNNAVELISRFLNLPDLCANRFQADSKGYIRQLQKIRDKYTYDSVSQYLHYYVPYLLVEMSRQIGNVLAEKGHFPSSANSESIVNAYVLMKEEYNSDIDFKLSILSPKHKLMQDCPQANDIVIIKMKTERCSDDTEGVFQDPAFLGIFLSTSTRVLQPDKYSIENIIVENGSPEFSNDYLCEESVLRTMNHNALYDRSDYHLGIYKLFNCSQILQAATALYMLDDYAYKDHFLKPVMEIKTSGVIINEDLINDPERFDTFQKAIDLVGQNDPSSSSFLAVDLEVPYYQSFIIPVLKQLVNNLPFFKAKEDEKTPILIISEEEDFRKDLFEDLTADGFYDKNAVIIDPSKDLETQIDEQLVETYQSHITTLENGALHKRSGIERYSKCIDYLQKQRAINDLSTHWIAEMLRNRKEIKKKLLKNAKVIITNCETVFTDPIYLTNFNRKPANEQRILCCIICEAHNQPEMKTLAFTNFGIKKYIFLGSIHQLRFQEPTPAHEPLDERLISFTRSLFERLYSLHRAGPVLINSSFVVAEPDY